MTKELLYQNKKIFYCSIGTGKPVMLLHGFGEDGEVWGPHQTSPARGGLASTQTLLFENSSLTTRFKFIIPDLPGSGKSEMVDDMSMEGIAEVMKAVLDREASLPPEGGFSGSSVSYDSSQVSGSEVPPCGGFRGAVIGHSMGGYIALALAEKYPEYLSALGLFHSSAYADTEEKKATRRKGIEFIRQHGAFEFLKTAIPNLFSPQSKDEMNESIAEFIQKQHNFLPEALVSYYEAMMQRPDRTEMLRKSAVPVLFIMGKYDNAVPLNDMLEQCHLPEKSYIHILRKSGHMGMIEEPEAANRILDEFLLEI